MEPLICYQCNYQTYEKSKYDLHEKTKRHQRRTQDINTTWFKCGKCHICPFASDNLNQMKKHIRQHELKSNKCHCCDETFETKEELNTHFDTVLHCVNLRNKLRVRDNIQDINA